MLRRGNEIDVAGERSLQGSVCVDVEPVLRGLDDGKVEYVIESREFLGTVPLDRDPAGSPGVLNAIKLIGGSALGCEPSRIDGSKRRCNDLDHDLG